MSTQEILLEEIKHQPESMLRELNQAIERQGNKPLVPWAEAKKDLGLA